MKTTRQCLDCGRDMTLEEWYPEMLCETCKQEIDSALTDEDRQEGFGVSRWVLLGKWQPVSRDAAGTA